MLHNIRADSALWGSHNFGRPCKEMPHSTPQALSCIKVSWRRSVCLEVTVSKNCVSAVNRFRDRLGCLQQLQLWYVLKYNGDLRRFHWHLRIRSDLWNVWHTSQKHVWICNSSLGNGSKIKGVFKSQRILVVYLVSVSTHPYHVLDGKKCRTLKSLFRNVVFTVIVSFTAL